MKQGFVKYCLYHQILSGITRYLEGSKKHLDDPVPNGDLPVLVLDHQQGVSDCQYLVTDQKVCV
jgi:hypothetical protein